MAEGPRMTAAQLADKLLASEHADVLRESVAWIVAELMEAEVAAKVGAELGERTPERLTQRNGYRTRSWDTRVGELELAIPRLRTGSYFPSFLEPRRRVFCERPLEGRYPYLWLDAKVENGSASPAGSGTRRW